MQSHYQVHRPAYLQDMDSPLQALLAQADAPADTTGQPPKIRVSTWIMAAITVLCIAMIPAGEAAAALGIVFGFVFFLIWLGKFSNDIRIPAARGRKSPLDAINCYFRAIQVRRWDTAFACLSPMAKDRTVAIPPIRELNNTPVQLARSTPAQLKAYWRSIAHPGNSMTRRITSIHAVPLSQEGNVCCYRVTLSIEYYSSWVFLGVLLGLLPMLILWLALRKHYHLTFNVVAYKHKTQWWLLSGELPPPGPMMHMSQMPQMPQAQVHAGYGA